MSISFIKTFSNLPEVFYLIFLEPKDAFATFKGPARLCYNIEHIDSISFTFPKTPEEVQKYWEAEKLGLLKIERHGCQLSPIVKYKLTKQYGDKNPWLPELWHNDAGEQVYFPNYKVNNIGIFAKIKNWFKSFLLHT